MSYAQSDLCYDAGGNLILCQPKLTYVLSDTSVISTVGYHSTGLSMPVTVRTSTVVVTGLNSASLATEATLSSLNGKVTAVNTGDVTISAWPTTFGAAGAIRCVNAAGTAFEACGSAAGLTDTQLRATPVPISGSLSANQSVNASQINGVAPLMGNGVTGTGSQRVTIASDNTPFSVNTTLQTGSNVIGALTANQTVAQGTASSLKAEVVGPTADNAANPTAKLSVLAGVANAAAPTRTEGNVVPLRTNLAGDVAVTLDGETVALVANQTVNVAQMNGVATSMGNGIAGTGVQRVAIASDNTAFPVNATATQGTASNLKAEVVGPTADNAANPTAKLSVLAAIAKTADPAWTDTNAVPLRTNLAGDLAVTLNGEAVVLGAGVATIGALAANQSVNVAQINGVAPLMGNGVTGTGSQRVTIASDNTPFPIAEQRASTLWVTATAAVNTALTLTLPAAGAGLFHYITSMQVHKLYAVVGTANAAGVILTTTNLPGNPAFTTEQAAGALGTVKDVVNLSPVTPIKSSVANTATTIVAPAQAQTIWRMNVTYFTAQ